MVSTGAVITLVTGASATARKAMRRTTSCSVTMPSMRPAASTTSAAEARSAAIAATAAPIVASGGTRASGATASSPARRRKMAASECIRAPLSYAGDSASSSRRTGAGSSAAASLAAKPAKPKRTAPKAASLSFSLLSE